MQVWGCSRARDIFRTPAFLQRDYLLLLLSIKRHGVVPGNQGRNFRGGYSSEDASGGGGKKRGEENLMNDTPPKKGVVDPPRTVRFPRQSRPEALLEGSENFRESALSGTFSSPHTFLREKTKGQQLKGKNVSEFFTLFRTFSEFFPQDFPLKAKGF